MANKIKCCINYIKPVMFLMLNDFSILYDVKAKGMKKALVKLL